MCAKLTPNWKVIQDLKIALKKENILQHNILSDIPESIERQNKVL